MDLLNVLEYVEPPADPPADPGDPGDPITIVVTFRVAPTFADGRLNAWDTAATAVLYCATSPAGELLGGIDSYGVTGSGVDFAFQALSADILPALANALTTGQSVLIEQQLGVSLWALPSGELQANGSDGYVFTFPATVCGLLD